MAVQGGSSSSSGLLRALWSLLVLLVVALIALLIWQATGGGGGDEDEAAAPAPAAPGAARIVGVEELREAAAGSDVPVYWAGPRPGAELELSEVGKARAYVRYLTGGAEAGDPKPGFLAIGTYRLPDALAALRANAKRSGVKLRKAPRGALVWVDPQSPTSAYLVYPGDDFEVEVYDPSPKRALGVALSPHLRPVVLP
jgi:hypothetical protein